MIDDAEHGARFQRLAKGAQRPVHLVAFDPIVQVSEREDKIGTAWRSDLVLIGVEFRDKDLSLKGGVGLEPRQ